MWIFTKDGFISVVQHESDPALVRVRARKREHLERWFPHADIIEMDAEADYRWHADVERLDLVVVLTDAVFDLDYTSHVKEAIAGDDDDFYKALLDTWFALHELQREPEPEPPLRPIGKRRGWRRGRKAVAA